MPEKMETQPRRANEHSEGSTQDTNLAIFNGLRDLKISGGVFPVIPHRPQDGAKAGMFNYLC